ncbi:MAG TPA: ABC transporter ATP-binding protein [Candidatus Cloacimonadota bacterium]|nr:ABC transporter ATP-binding protein [Candidatus Cloacimonadota bacterium]HOQ80370.1 ABC transporter ATP-binding protein [Candidatus Cloacimonadota bacterium]
MIKVDKVSKTFTKNNELFYALRDINFELNNGEICGLIGLNGAGKTTLLRLMVGVYSCTNGLINYDEQNIKDFNKSHPFQISFLSSDTQVYQRLTIREYLHFFAKIKQIEKHTFEKRLLEYSQKLNLESELDSILEHTSTGTKQKAAFLSAVINQPQYLILDEPFANVDILMVDEMLNIIKDLQYNGSSVIISSHNLYEIESIADSVLLIDSGLIKLRESLTLLKNENQGNTLKSIILELLKES